jgi:predicted nucleic acid-binding protein
VIAAAVLDAGALIAVERRDRAILADLAVIIRHKVPAFVPAGVVAQAWRGSPRQHDLAVLLASQCVRVEPLDEPTALRLGLLLGASSACDVTDAHVAHLATQKNARVYTSDPADIRALAPNADIQPV